MQMLKKWRLALLGVVLVFGSGSIWNGAKLGLSQEPSAPTDPSATGSSATGSGTIGSGEAALQTGGLLGKLNPQNLADVQTALQESDQWAAKVKNLSAQLSDEKLVLDVAYFKTALGVENIKELKGIAAFSARPIVDLRIWHSEVLQIIVAFPAGSDPDDVIEAWHTAMANTLRQMPEDDGRLASGELEDPGAPKILWEQFFKKWEADAKAKGKEKFRDALIQAPLISEGLMIGVQEQIIKAAFAPSQEQGRRSAGAGGGSASSYGGRLIHTKIMHHMIESHARKMRRIMSR